MMPTAWAFGFGLGRLPAAGSGPEGETLLCLINRDNVPVPFLLPAGAWQQICDSSAPAPFAIHLREKMTPVEARSVQILGMGRRFQQDRTEAD